MKRASLLIAVVGIALLLTSCYANKKHTSEAFYSNKCEYLNTELDGSMTLRAYGQGRNRIDARHQARKNAVYQVIFEGVYVPNNAAMSRPLVYEANAHQKYEDFFNDFFTDGGDYTKFVNKKDKKDDTNEKSWGGAQTKISTTVTVERSKLKTYLKQQGIIKE